MENSDEKNSESMSETILPILREIADPERVHTDFAPMKLEWLLNIGIDPKDIHAGLDCLFSEAGPKQQIRIKYFKICVDRLENDSRAYNISLEFGKQAKLPFVLEDAVGVSRPNCTKVITRSGGSLAEFRSRVRKTHSDLGVRKTHPDLGVRKTHPDLGVRKTHSGLGVRKTHPGLGVRKTHPDLGAPKGSP